MNFPTRTLLAFAIIALVQTVVLGSMVFERVRLIKTGREITLPIIPVDPRDFFKGEYVRLGYAIGSLRAGLLEGPAPEPSAPFYVTLEKKDGGEWLPVKVSVAMPAATSPDRIVLKARNAFRWATGNPAAPQFARYGIESYYVPEGEGRRLEDLARDKKLAALLAVDRNGQAAIKGLIIDGKLEYVDSLF